MRKVSVLIGICMLVALALTLVAQAPTDLSPIMKDVAATQTSMRMNLMNNAAADVAKDAAKLQDDFTKAMGFFKAMKAAALFMRFILMLVWVAATSFMIGER